MSASYVSLSFCFLALILFSPVWARSITFSETFSNSSHEYHGLESRCRSGWRAYFDDIRRDFPAVGDATTEPSTMLGWNGLAQPGTQHTGVLGHPYS